MRDSLIESFLKDLIHILAIAGRTGEVLVPSFLGIGDSLCLFYFFGSAVVFVADEHDYCVFEVDSVIFHGGLPPLQTVEGLAVF